MAASDMRIHHRVLREDGTDAPPVRIELLADNPHLIPAIGQMRYKEWGEPTTTGSEGVDAWIEITSHEAGRDKLPVTWVAIDEYGDAIGAAGVLPGSDIADRPEFSPSVVGVIVDQRQRRMGAGRRLLAVIEQWAHDHGIGQLYVVTGDDATGFYRKCGWEVVEETTITWPSVNVTEHVTILTRIV
jgi:GNAT superfamily N-acetyltransferase